LVKWKMGDGTSLMTLKIPVVRHQFPGPVELVEQTNRDHCSRTVAESAGMGEVGEVPVAVAVGWRDLWLFVVDPVKAVTAGVVGKAKRSAGNRRPAVPVVELYVNGSANESG
jgi:hypothetical protein